MPLKMFGRKLDIESSRQKLKFWFFLIKAVLALTALADLLIRRQAVAASLFALAAAMPLEPWGVPSWVFALPSSLLSAIVLNREGVDAVEGAVLGIFTLSAALIFLGTLRRDARSIE